MPIGEGFWLHQTGKHIEIFEHLSAVLEDPKKFGLSSDDVRRKSVEPDDDYRRRVLTTVLKKGWIRVRSHKGVTVFEYNKLTRRIADAIWDFIVEVLGTGPLASYEMHEVSSGRFFSVKAATFYDDVETRLGDPSFAGGEKIYLMGRAMGHGL